MALFQEVLLARLSSHSRASLGKTHTLLHIYFAASKPPHQVPSCHDAHRDTSRGRELRGAVTDAFETIDATDDGEISIVELCKWLDGELKPGGAPASQSKKADKQRLKAAGGPQR